MNEGDNILDSYLKLLVQTTKAEIMSELSDKIAEVRQTQDEAIERVRVDVSDLQTQIDELRAKVTTPEDIAALDAIAAKNRALDPVRPDVLPTDPDAEPEA